MRSVPPAGACEIGFDVNRLQAAIDLLANWAAGNKVTAAALGLGRRGRAIEPITVGRQRVSTDSPPLRRDALFLVASITKPLVVGAAMLLVERGLLALQDRVADFLPRFRGDGRDDVQIRHLMTHTSGLPDMVADNLALRKAHRPLAAFVEAIYAEPLLFPPGTKVSYQSMGTALLGEIVEQTSALPQREFLRREFFEPLQMLDTTLGWDETKKERIAEIRVPAEMEGKDWNWNSPYWLGLGAPWGGLITSVADMGRFCQMMLNEGELDGARIFSPATVRTMTSNHLAAMPRIPEEDRRCKPWGLGWRLNWPGHTAHFGDLLGPRSYGHWGATGTITWIDPDAQAYFNLFTTQPQDANGYFLAKLSNAVCAALV